jgi:hypothetical protein
MKAMPATPKPIKQVKTFAMRERSKQVPTIFLADPPETKVEKRQPRRRSIIREFCANTSAHALPGIARSQTMHNRMFWAISFIIFTGIMVYFVTAAVIAYFHYPTSIDINIVSEWPQYFPAVSICNVSPMRLDRFSEPFLNFTRENNLTSPNSSAFSAYQLSNIGKFVGVGLNRNLSLGEYFFSLPSMLYSCIFNNQPCSPSDFISFTSSTYGSCYTFNAQLKENKNRTVRYVNQYGGEGSLSLEFFIHSHQYVPNIYNGMPLSFDVICLFTNFSSTSLIQRLEWWLWCMTTHNCR